MKLMTAKEFQIHLCEKDVRRLIGYGITNWKKVNSYGLSNKEVKNIYKKVLTTIKYYC